LDVDFIYEDDCEPVMAVTAVASGGTPPYIYMWNNNPPGGPTINLAANGGSNKITVIDANGCVFETDVYAAPGNHPYDIDNGLSVSGGIIWQNVGTQNDPFSILGRILVTSSGSLTIKDSYIRFADTKKTGVVTDIRVEAGGILIVDNSTLTAHDYCIQWMWDGIDLLGLDNVPQIDPLLPNGSTDPNNPQSFVHVRNNSVVEHARIGIQNGIINQIPNPSGGPPFQQIIAGGGVVYTDNTTFLNNRIGIQMGRYKFSHRSRFIANTFSCTAPMKDPDYNSEGTLDFVRLIDVRGDFTEAIQGLRFEDNTFINIGSFAEDKLGSGITAWRSSFNVGRFTIAAPEWLWHGDNYFIGLSKGIDVYNNASLKQTVKVHKNYFQNTRQGITLNGSIMHEIIDNEFDPIPDGTPGHDTWGAFALSSSGYDIWRNRFAGSHSGGTSGVNTWGVVSRNSGSVGSLIYKNHFEGIHQVGTQTEQNNHALLIDCNTYVANQWDWYVTSGFLVDQGDPCGANNSRQVWNLFHPFSTCPYDEHVGLYVGWPAAVDLDYWYVTNGQPTCNAADVVNHDCANNQPNPCTDIPWHTDIYDFTDTISDMTMRLVERDSIMELVELGDIHAALVLLASLASADSARFDRYIKVLVPTLYDRDSCIAADSLLQMLPQSSNENTAFVELWQLLIDSCIVGSDIYDVDSSALATIQDVANSSTSVAVQAQSWLALLSLTSYQRYPEGTAIPKRGEATRHIGFLIYPNPTAGLLWLSWSEHDSYDIQITDALGRVMKRLAGGFSSVGLDVRSFPLGAYFVRYVSSSGSTGTATFIKQ
jgi:hypothetical protein